ncbi:hypothetical protein JCM14469_10840 [Desulfatiferula olefinivorans]
MATDMVIRDCRSRNVGEILLFFLNVFERSGYRPIENATKDATASRGFIGNQGNAGGKYANGS